MNPSPVSEQPRPLKILVVEDNLDQVRSLTALLRDLGHQVDYAINGYAALNLATRFKPDVMIIDIGLPGMDGFHMYEQLKENRELRAVRAIALTAYDGPEYRQRAKQAGFSEYIVKPQVRDDWSRLLGDLAKRG